MKETMTGKMKNRTGSLVKTGLLVSALALTLAGCGASPKKEFTKGHDEISNAKTLEMTTSVSIQADGAGVDPEITGILNTLELKADIKSDLQKKQHEVNAGIGANMGAMSMKLDLPMFIDEKGEKVYTKADSYTELMSTVMTFVSPMPMLAVETPESLKGKVVEISAEDIEAEAGVEPTEAEKKKQEQAIEKVSKEFEAYLKDVPESAFTKKDDVVTFKADGQKVVDMVFDTLEKNPDLLGGDDMTSEIADMRKAFKENLKVGEVTVDTTMKGNSISSEKILIPMTVEEDGEKMTVTVAIVNTYKSVNKKLDFSFDLDEKNIIQQDEFENVLNEALMGSMGFDAEDGE